MGMTTAVIYIFRCPKGRVYAGWRGVSPEALRCWPNRGTGPLPDGYTGSGTAWEGVARKHGAGLVWRILARVDGARADVDAAERRAIRLARATFGRRCLNIRDGGEGSTSAEARALWADPAYVQRTKAGMKAAMARPEVKAKLSAAGKRSWADPAYAERMKRVIAEVMERPGVLDRRNAGIREAHTRAETKAKTRRHLERLQADPDWQERRDAGLAKAKVAASAPEVRAKANASNSVTHKALAQTPERQALFVRAAQIGHRKRRARKALAPFSVPPSISRPGVCLWAYLPPLRLSLSVSLQRPRGKHKQLL